MNSDLQPGQLLARGVSRHLIVQYNYAPLCEFVPTRGLRVDVIAVGPKGEIWVIECKSSRADFMSDNKWQGYLEWCDRFYWCVDKDFPQEILPEGAGLIIADQFDAAIVSHGPETKLAAARRKAMIQKIARTSMSRLHGFVDPRPGQRFELSD